VNCMAQHTDDDKIHLLLLQESMWQIEDKIDTSLEEIAKHQAALRQIKNMTESLMHKLGIKIPKNTCRRLRK
jgi:hypothetical protein